MALVREKVIDALTPGQVTELGEITDAILHRLDPGGAKATLYQRYDS